MGLFFLAGKVVLFASKYVSVFNDEIYNNTRIEILMAFSRVLFGDTEIS